MCTKIALFLIILEPACRNQRSTDFITKLVLSHHLRQKAANSLTFTHANNMALSFALELVRVSFYKYK